MYFVGLLVKLKPHTRRWPDEHKYGPAGDTFNRHIVSNSVNIAINSLKWPSWLVTYDMIAENDLSYCWCSLLCDGALVQYTCDLWWLVDWLVGPMYIRRKDTVIVDLPGSFFSSSHATLWPQKRPMLWTYGRKSTNPVLTHPNSYIAPPQERQLKLDLNSSTRWATTAQKLALERGQR